MNNKPILSPQRILHLWGLHYPGNQIKYPFILSTAHLSPWAGSAATGEDAPRARRAEGNRFKHLVQPQLLEIMHLDEKMKSAHLFCAHGEATGHSSASDEGLVTPEDTARPTASRQLPAPSNGRERDGKGPPECAESRVGGLRQQQGQGCREPHTAVSCNFNFNWPWHTLDDFLHNKFIFLIISLINLIISWANI